MLEIGYDSIFKVTGFVWLFCINHIKSTKVCLPQKGFIRDKSYFESSYVWKYPHT